MAGLLIAVLVGACSSRVVERTDPTPVAFTARELAALLPDEISGRPVTYEKVDPPSLGTSLAKTIGVPIEGIYEHWGTVRSLYLNVAILGIPGVDGRRLLEPAIGIVDPAILARDTGR